MSLRQPQKKAHRKHPVAGTVIGILSQYALQTFVGFCLVLLLMSTICPDLFTGFGLLMPLGFLLGPGQAYTIALPWESIGWHNAGATGLTFGAIGFLWASLGGFVMINLGLKKGWLGCSTDSQAEPVAASPVIPTENLLKTAGLSLHLTLILLIYLLTFLLLKGLSLILSLAGEIGLQFAESLWGITFIWGSLTASLVRNLLNRFSNKPLFSEQTLSSINSFSVNIMVAAAFGAISLITMGQYWLPLVIFSLVGGLLSFFTLPWLCSRLFDEHAFHKTLILYGALTGTLPTGLVLLKSIDPDFKTPVVSDYISAAGIVFLLVIPMILSLQFPAQAYRTGNPLWNWITLGIFGLYLIGVTVAYLVTAKQRALAKAGQLWYKE